MERKAHWEHVYRTRSPTEVSWYQAQPVRSLELLDEAGLGAESVLIDVGGGDSLLVDALVARGMTHVAVLDLSESALARARARLGARASAVTWLEGDITRIELPAHAYDVWHDRAVFHFLTDAEDRRRYVAAASRALRSGGTLILATFALDGPARCSGLPVARYSPETLAEELGADFALQRGFGDVHRTPGGAEQRFTYAVFRRR